MKNDLLRRQISVLAWGALLWGVPVSLLVLVYERSLLPVAESLNLPVETWRAVLAPAAACAGWWTVSAGTGCLFWWMLTRVTGARWSDRLIPAWKRGIGFLCATGWGLAGWAFAAPFFGEGDNLSDRESLFYFLREFWPMILVLSVVGILAVLLVQIERRGLEKRTRFASALGLIVLVPAMAWMTVLREGGWITSMAPLNGMADAAAAGLAWALLSREARADAVRRPALLLLTAVLALGLYLAYSRFLIVSYGGIPAETSFYAARSEGEWGVVWAVLAVLAIVLPLLAALAATVGRSVAAARFSALLALMATVAWAGWNALPGISSSAGTCLAFMAVSLLPLAGPLLWNRRGREQTTDPGKD